MSILSTRNVGYGLIGVGGAITAASFVPSSLSVGTGALPSSALFIGGVGVAGIGATMAVMGAKD